MAARAVLTVLVAAAPMPSLWSVVSATRVTVDRGAPLRPAEALTAVAACAALVGLGWLVLGVLLALVSTGSGAVGRATGRVGDVVTPRALGNVVGALLGVVVAAGVSPGASLAAPGTRVVAPAVPGVAPAPPPDPGFAPLPDPGWAPLDDSASGSGRGWVPAPPVVRAHPDVRVLSPTARDRAESERPSEVVVRRGDSLWVIAARHLGPDASDAEIAGSWPAWFEANRDVIGDDPDLLRPGQLLRPPGVVPS